MKQIVSILLCIALFTACLVGLDHLFVTVDANVPVYAEVRRFYLDFRKRLQGMAITEGTETVERVIERKSAPPSKSQQEESYSPGYIYVDEKGDLQFAERIEEIPLRFRKDAQPLKQ